MTVTDIPMDDDLPPLGGGLNDGDSNNELSPYENYDPATMWSAMDIADRQALIRDIAPAIAQDNQLALELAGSGLDLVELARGMSALEGMVTAERLRTSMAYLTPDQQRAAFNTLSSSQQTGLIATGYQVPAQQDQNWFIDGIGAIGSGIGTLFDNPVGQAVVWAAKPVVSGMEFLYQTTIGQPYRTIRQLDSWTQVAALAAGVAGGVAAVVAAPVTFGASLAAYGGTMAALGTGIFVGTQAANATALGIETVKAVGPNENEFIQAWSRASDGESLFTQNSQNIARNLLDHDSFVQIARDISADLDPYDVAAHFAGVYDTGQPELRVTLANELASQYADYGSPEWQRVTELLSELMDNQEFNAAIVALQNGKISPGRDVARLLQMDPGSRTYNITSGAVDAFWRMYADPINIAGPTVRYLRLERFGVFEDGGRTVNSMIHSYDPNRFVALAEHPRVVAAHTDFANSVNAGRFDMVVPNMRQAYQPFQEYLFSIGKRSATGEMLQEATREDVVQFFLSQAGLGLIMKGVGMRRGYNGLHVLKPVSNTVGLGRLRRQLLDFRNGMLDDGTAMRRLLAAADEAGIDARILNPSYQENLQLDGLVRPFDELVEEGTVAYKAGRTLGYVNRATGNTIGWLAGKLDTLAPLGYVNLTTGEGIQRAIDATGSVFGLSPQAKAAWLNTAMNQGTNAARGRVMYAFYDTIFNTSGFRATERGNQIADDFLRKMGHAYGLGNVDQIEAASDIATNVLNRGVLIGDMAENMSVPNIREIIRAQRRDVAFSTFGGILRPGDVIEYATGKIFKPLVLLRAGFITRNAGEELMSWFARGTEGAIWQEKTARKLAKHQAWRQAHTKLLEQGPQALNAAENAALNWQHTTSGRLLSRVVGGAGDEGLAGVVIDGYETWLRGVWERGLLPKLGAKVDTQNPMLQLLLTGRQHSWRNMGLRGVSPELRHGANKWVQKHARSVMQAASANARSIYDDIVSSPQQAMQALSAEGEAIPIPLMAVTTQNERYSSGNPHFAWAEHHQALRVVNDPAMGNVLSEFLPRVLPQHPDFNPQQWGRVLNGLSPDNDTANMLVTELLWAVPDRLRYLADEIETFNPGLADALRRFNEANSTGTPLGDAFTDFIQELLSGDIAELYRWERFIGFVQNDLDAIYALDPQVRAFMAVSASAERVSWAKNGTPFYNRDIIDALGSNVDNIADIYAPKNVVYRGVANQNAGTMVPQSDGSLIIYPTFQKHWLAAEDINNPLPAGQAGYGVATTNDPTQALLYSTNSIGDGQAPMQGVIYEIDFEALAQASNSSRTYSDVVGNPQPFSAINPSMLGEPQLFTRQGSKVAEINWSTRSSEPIVIPAGRWRTFESAEMSVSVRSPFWDDITTKSDWVSQKFFTGAGLHPDDAELLSIYLSTMQEEIYRLAQEQTTRSIPDATGNLRTVLGRTLPSEYLPFVNDPSGETLLNTLADIIKTRLGSPLETVDDKIKFQTMNAVVEEFTDMYMSSVEQVYGTQVNLLFGNDDPARVKSLIEQQISLPLSYTLSGTLNPNFTEVSRDLESVAQIAVGFLADESSNYVAAVLANPKIQEILDGLYGPESNLVRGKVTWLFDDFVNGVLQTDPAMYSEMIRGRISQMRSGYLNEHYGEYLAGGWSQQLPANVIGHFAMLAYGPRLDATPLVFRNGFDPDISVARLLSERQAGGYLPTGQKIYTEFGSDAVNDLTDLAWAELTRGQHANMLNRSEFMVRTRSGQHVVQEGRRGTRTVFAVPLTNPNRLATTFTEVATAIPVESGEKFIDAVTDRLLGSYIARTSQGNLLGDLSMDELRNALKLTVQELYNANGKLGLVNAPSGFFPNVGFEDPRVAQWVRDVINNTPPELADEVLYQTVMPVWLAHNENASTATATQQVQLLSNMNDTGRVFKFTGNPYEWSAVSGKTISTGPGGMPQYGIPWAQGAREFAGQSVESIAQRVLTDVNETYFVNNANTVFDTPPTPQNPNPVALPEGTRISLGQQVFDADGNALSVADGNLFSQVVEIGGGDIKWPLIAPMLMDNYDDMLGGRLYAPRAAMDLDTGTVLSDGDMVRLTRSRISDAELLPTNLRPNVALAPKLVSPKTMQDNVFQRMINYTFSNVFGKAIDGLARTPMAFHEFTTSLGQNYRFISGFVDPNLTELMRGFSTFNYYGGTSDLVYGADAGMEALQRLREPFESLEQADALVVATLFDGVPTTLLDDVIEGRRDIYDLYDWLARTPLTGNNDLDVARRTVQFPVKDADAADFARGIKSTQSFMTVAEDSAAQRAIAETIRYIDSSEERSVFSMYVKNLLPFFYAEENFIKRWARTIAETGDFGLSELNRAVLTINGLRESGFIREDPNGELWVVYPGTGAVNAFISQLFNLGGENANYGTMNRARLNALFPGMSEQAGRPGFGWLMGIPLAVGTNLFPELAPVKRGILGDIGANRTLVEQIVPAQAGRLVDALVNVLRDGEVSSISLMNQFYNVTAMAYARGDVPDTTATPDEWQEFYERMINQARVTYFTNAVMGVLAPVPGTPSPVVTGESWASLTADNPASLFSDSYREYITFYGLEEGVDRWLADNPHGTLADVINPLAFTVSRSFTVGTAPLPATETANTWYDNNVDYMAKYPMGAGWFVPTQGYNQAEPLTNYAYGMQYVNEMRKRMAPKDYINSIIFRFDSYEYYNMIDERDAEMAAAVSAGQDPGIIEADWEVKLDYFKSTHPVFTQRLSETASQDRRDTISQIRTMVALPNETESPYYDAIKELSREYDIFIAAKQQWGTSSSANNRLLLSSLDTAFKDFGDRWAILNPDLEMLWISIYKQESGVDQ